MGGGCVTDSRSSKTGLPALTLSNYDRRSVETLDELGWNNFETRWIRQLATMAYKLINGTMPNHLTKIFSCTNSLYS